jgi:hypothetical protein
MPTTASSLRPDMTRDRPAWRMPAPRDLVVKGERIRYFEQGDGAPLVLMHGFSGSAQFEWGRVIDDLSRNHRVIAPQCVGFAPSAQPDITYSTAALVDHLGAVFAALDLTGIIRFHFLGDDAADLGRSRRTDSARTRPRGRARDSRRAAGRAERHRPHSVGRVPRRVRARRGRIRLAVNR